jgi:hypothetical protein
MDKIEAENGHLKEGDFEEELPENAIPRGGTADISKRWNYKMTVVVDPSYRKHIYIYLSHPSI